MPHPDHSTIDELCHSIEHLHDPESRALDDPWAIAAAVRRFASEQAELVRRAEETAHHAVMRIEADDRWAKRARAAEQRVVELEKAAHAVVDGVKLGEGLTGRAPIAASDALRVLLDLPWAVTGAAQPVFTALKYESGEEPMVGDRITWDCDDVDEWTVEAIDLSKPEHPVRVISDEGKRDGVKPYVYTLLRRATP